jgi:hypothetical protein
MYRTSPFPEIKMTLQLRMHCPIQDIVELVNKVYYLEDITSVIKATVAIRYCYNTFINLSLRIHKKKIKYNS